MSENPENKGETIFNPENPDHIKVIETVEEFVQRKERIDSKGKLVKEIKPILSDKDIGYTTDYINRLLAYGGDKHLRERNSVEIREDPRGGNPAKVYIAAHEQAEK